MNAVTCMNPKLCLRKGRKGRGGYDQNQAAHLPCLILELRGTLMLVSSKQDTKPRK